MRYKTITVGRTSPAHTGGEYYNRDYSSFLYANRGVTTVFFTPQTTYLLYYVSRKQPTSAALYMHNVYIYVSCIHYTSVCTYFRKIPGIFHANLQRLTLHSIICDILVLWSKAKRRVFFLAIALLPPPPRPVGSILFGTRLAILRRAADLLPPKARGSS